jgi:hypothetical protein
VMAVAVILLGFAAVNASAAEHTPTVEETHASDP